MNAPEIMAGDEGETAFVRRDLATTVTAALKLLLAGGSNFDGSDVDEVEMLPVPDHFIGVDADWWTVRYGTPGAIAYWRFRI